MSADEQVAIARIEQKVEDMDKTMTDFVHEIRSWRGEVDAERNKVKGAVVAVGLVSGAVGGLLGWIGRNVRLFL